MVELIVDALRWWVAEIGVDGFRFDLAAALVRGEDGEPLADPPLQRRIESEPQRAAPQHVAESWDAAGLYLVGGFARRPRRGGGWREWNDRFRDDVRRFVRGEPGMTRALAARLAGSPDLFAGAPLGPGHSINYVTCHDGFTLADLVAYDRKHNEANGEHNRDGADENFSWNCGFEGPSSDRTVVELRRRQIRNFLTILMLSQGTPMLLAGDEFGRTQRGNNNPYCQDNEISWVDWTLAETNRDLLRFTRLLIEFRRAHSVLRRSDFLTGEETEHAPGRDVTWHGMRLDGPDWTSESLTLAMHLSGEHAEPPDCDIYFAANASDEDLSFELPAPPRNTRWACVIDTAEPSPRDIAADGEEPAVGATAVTVGAYSCVVLRTR
jgi:glycogen operon protein